MPLKLKKKNDNTMVSIRVYNFCVWWIHIQLRFENCIIFMLETWEEIGTDENLKSKLPCQLHYRSLQIFPQSSNTIFLAFLCKIAYILYIYIHLYLIKRTAMFFYAIPCSKDTSLDVDRVIHSRIESDYSYYEYIDLYLT